MLTCDLSVERWETREGMWLRMKEGRRKKARLA